MSVLKRETIDRVRERARLDRIVGEYVTLRPAGTGSLKGLCPFHDEKTPSFTIRAQVGLWHCFGCGAGGDVIDFIMRIHNLDFLEAVEFLAAQVGVELQYEKGGAYRQSDAPPQVRRQTLLEMHKIAEEFYREQYASPSGQNARDFLAKRQFSEAETSKFGIGYSLPEWDSLARLLRGRGFTEMQLAASGLFVEGRRGLYDRFRGRLMWPIRDLTGATIGFGARKLGGAEDSPKYLNTPETQIYHKSSVLYGLDLARKTISQQRQIVIVEGYTDVMAAHCAGVTNAVATCGTAFGAGHVQVIRRLLGDRFDETARLSLENGNQYSGEVIYTFDGDEAGIKAARRAYMEDQAFAARTFVAIDPEGMDPCDIRMQRGEAALRSLIDSRRPLFEFVIRSVVETENLRTVEGRIAGLNKVIPVLAGIEDVPLRNAYIQYVAGWLSMNPDQVRSQVERALKQRLQQSRSRNSQQGASRGWQQDVQPGREGDAQPSQKRRIQQYPHSDGNSGNSRGVGGSGGAGSALGAGANAVGTSSGASTGIGVGAGSGGSSFLHSLSGDPVVQLEAQVLELALQHPFACTASDFEGLTREVFSERTLQAVHDAIAVAGGLMRFLDLQEEAESLSQIVGQGAVEPEVLAASKWNEEVRAAASVPQIRDVIVELSTVELPLAAGADSERVELFAREAVWRLQLLNLNRQLADLRAQLNLTQDVDEVNCLQVQMDRLGAQARGIKAELAGA